MSSRGRVLSGLAADIAALRLDHPVRVGVDGITAAGKSTFAAGLTDAVTAAGRPSRHLSTDDHHYVVARRRRDPDAGRGYYDDAYDLRGFATRVLVPLGPDGDRRILPRAHDLATDEVLDGPVEEVATDAVVVVDGSFLQRPELAGQWDVVVWLEVPFETAVERAVVRDAELLGGADEVRAAYRDRYHAACRLYLDAIDPRSRATYVVDNTDPAAPTLVG